MVGGRYFAQSGHEFFIGEPWMTDDFGVPEALAGLKQADKDVDASSYMRWADGNAYPVRSGVDQPEVYDFAGAGLAKAYGL